MPRFAIYTLTRDRLKYTQECFQRLRDYAGEDYDHYVIDNGSEDGTAKWLKDNKHLFKAVQLNPKNVGISRGSNQALSEIYSRGIAYDYVIKMDNDCLILTKSILPKIHTVYDGLGLIARKYILSPRVMGIANQPKRLSTKNVGEYTIGETSIVGGLFHVVPEKVYRFYRYQNNLPKAKYQDDFLCKWFIQTGGHVGYIEELVVEHKEGSHNQSKRYPEYFKRKWAEENEI